MNNVTIVRDMAGVTYITNMDINSSYVGKEYTLKNAYLFESGLVPISETEVRMSVNFMPIDPTVMESGEITIIISSVFRPSNKSQLPSLYMKRKVKDVGLVMV